MVEYTDDKGPLDFLASRGFKEVENGILVAPYEEGSVSLTEWDAINYLITEWDFILMSKVEYESVLYIINQLKI